MIRAGIGGWTYEPWRGTFYPPKLPHAQELAFASRALTTIEINGTFYRTQKPDTFRKWAEETPDGFVFSVKAPRYAVNKRVLAEAGPSIERFAESGLEQLGGKLGPDPLAVRAHEEVRRGGYRRLPGALAARGERHAAAPRA